MPRGRRGAARAVDVEVQAWRAGLASSSLSDWTTRDVRSGARLQLQQFPHNLAPLSSPPFAAAAHPIRSPIWPPVLACLAPRLPPAMSSPQCLRRLPAALRAAALRAPARSVTRAPAARSYSAIARAASSGLLGHASRYDAVPRRPRAPCSRR